MQSKATTVTQYLNELPADRKEAITKLRKIIKSNLPKGFKEVISYGMIGYVVPHSLYPPGYHTTPHLPLPFMNVASQKNFVAVYHMYLYGSPALLKWFTTEYEKAKHVSVLKTFKKFRFSCLESWQKKLRLMNGLRFMKKI